jgi:hypothetical protein
VIVGAKPRIPRSCSLASRGAGESPIGWSIVGRRFLLVEVPLPWPAEIETASGLPPGLDQVLAERADDADPFFEAIVPEPGASVSGRTRVILYGPSRDRGTGLIRSEHLVPAVEVADLVRAWLAGEPVGGDDESGATRDVVVCTHGAHDTCCGRFGAPAFLALRDGLGGPHLRVWRGSHTGGHRFAPTFLELPDGRSWGRLRPGDAERILRREGDPGLLRGQYRGFGRLPNYYERLVEAELLFRHGWSWLERGLAARVVAGHEFVYPEESDELDDRAVVELTATARDGSDERWSGLIVRGDDIETRGECGDHPWASPTFSVVELSRLEP